MRKVVARGYLVKDQSDARGYRGTTNSWGQIPQMFATKAGAGKNGAKVVRALLIVIEE